MEFLVFVFLFAVLLFLIIHHYRVEREREFFVPFEGLKKTERQFNYYILLTPEERLEKFEIFKKAINRLYTIIDDEEGLNYSKREQLNWDQLHADIEMLQYYDKNGKLSFVSQKEAITSYYLTKDELYSIDELLLNTCNRWLKELSEIENAILEAKRNLA